MTNTVFLDELRPTLYQNFVDSRRLDDAPVRDAVEGHDDLRKDAIKYLVHNDSAVDKEAFNESGLSFGKLRRAVEYAAYERYAQNHATDYTLGTN
jgi:hypothetical protein